MLNNEFYGIYNPTEGGSRKNIIHQLRSETGKGEMACYDIAPGIQISYNSLNMDSCFAPLAPKEDFLQIDHCLEGCYEFEMESGSVSFLGEGDLCVSNLCKDKQIFTSSRIPLKRYRGITIILEIETAQKTLNKNFPLSTINLEQIRDTLCATERSLLIKTKLEVDHVFSELYRVDERIRKPYSWLKVVELLLFLSLLDGGAMQRPQQFTDGVSKQTQQVYQHIIENPFAKNTIADLAVMFDVAESSLKRCFKSLSGTSIGTFTKIKCIEAAAQMLITEPTLNIGEIAEAAGYENQSKFSAAFKSVIGVTPIVYRHKNS